METVKYSGDIVPEKILPINDLYDKVIDEANFKLKEMGVTDAMLDAYIKDQESMSLLKVRTDVCFKDRVKDLLTCNNISANSLVAYFKSYPNKVIYPIGGILFSNITDEMKELYVRKNTDYGNSFDKSLDDDGLLVAKIRLGDKYNRFGSLIKNDSLVLDESIRDTLIDMANYAIMTIMWMDNNSIKS